MKITEKQRYVIFPMLFAIFFAWLLQVNLLLHGDVGYLLHATNQLWAGGIYGKDFFETNPPMILYLYSPVCLLAKWTAINVVSLFRGYIFFLIFFSVFFSAVLLDKIIQGQNKGLFYLLIYMILFVLLFLPVNQFGQREHLLMIFMLPYLFSAVLALENKRITPFFALIIGLLAGFGFALKPYFLAPLVLIELYLILSKRNLWGWIRIESIAVLGVLLIYLGSIFLFQPSYINVMLPLISKLYFIGVTEPWRVTLFKFPVLFCWLALLVYFAVGKRNHLINVLMLALVGMMLAFIIPRAAWYYHVLPAFGLACLLITSIMFAEGKFAYLTAALYGLAVISFPLFSSLFVFLAALEEKKVENKLVAYIQSLPQNNKAIVCFSGNTTKDCFPLVSDIQGTYPGRFPFFWWLRGMLILQYKGHVAEVAASRTYLFTKVADDLNKADLVIINTEDSRAVAGPDFDFVAFFAENDAFRHAWQHYRYLTTIASNKIYQRVDKI